MRSSDRHSQLASRPSLVRAFFAVVVALVAFGPPLATALDPTRPLPFFGRSVWQDELPQSTVSAILQTRDGYIWMATYEGVVRFNGVNFKVFDSRTVPELRSSSIRSLVEDKDGGLWIGTLSGGLTRYLNGAFKTFTVADGLPDDFVFALHTARDGSVWIGTNAGLARWTGAAFEVFTRNDGLAGNAVRSICEDGNGRLWIGTEGGGVCYRENGQFANFPLPESPGNTLVAAIAAAPDGSVWIGTNGGGLVRVHDGRTEVYSAAADGLASDLISSILPDDRGSIWIGTLSAGISRYRDGRFTNLSAKQGLSHDAVRSLAVDHEGSLWVGTNGGVTQLKDEKIVNFTTLHGLSQNNIRVVLEDSRGDVWVGTDGGGVNRVSGDVVTVLGAKEGLPDVFVRSLFEDRDGAIWIGMNGGGVTRVQGGQLRTWNAKSGLSNGVVYAICDDAEGNIWLGTVGGGIDILGRDGSIRNLSTKDGLARNDVRALRRVRSGAIWIGTGGGGLSVYDPSRPPESRIVTYTTGDGLANDSVFAIYEDSAGDVWIGTSGGLNRMRNGKLVKLTVDQGLFDNRIFQILEDGRGQFWLSSNKGVFRAAIADLNAVADGFKSTVETHAYGRVDGMGSNQCNGASQPAGWRRASGQLVFPTVGGLALIDPGDLRTNAVAPFVAIDRVVVDGKAIEPAAVVTLSSQSSKFEIGYDGLSFVEPDRVLFRYRLDGYDADWVDAGTRRVAFYNSLSPGEYTFRVSASNNDGIWSETGAEFRFVLPAPWWRTWWAILLWIALSFGLLYLVVQMRLRRLERRTHELEAAVVERTAELGRTVEQLQLSEQRALESEKLAIEASRAKSTFLSNMSHELRTPLNAVLGFAELMEREASRSDADRTRLNIIQRSGEHLLSLINDVLSLSKIEAGKLTLNSSAFDLPAMLQSLDQMMRMRVEGKGLNLSVEADSSVPRVVRGDEVKLRQILINLLGNAVKFTESGTIRVRATWLDGIAKFEVEDSGCGISAGELSKLFEPFVQTESGVRSGEGTGLGLAISREFAGLMGGDLSVRSELGVGTTFVVSVPLPAGDAGEVQRKRARVRGLSPGQDLVRVLVADDTRENRLLLVQLLAPMGFEVREAGEGLEAVEDWERLRPQALFLDIRMPKMSGREVARTIRRREAEIGDGRRTFVAALTASAFMADRQDILDSGCDAFLTKPFRTEAIVEVLAESLGLRFDFELDGELEPELVESEAMTRERFSRLPQAVLDELADALGRGDVERAKRAVPGIREIDEELADELFGALRAYRLDAVLDLVDGGEGAVSK